MKLRKDYLLIDNHLKKCYYQKKAWRQIKSKVTGHQFAIDPIQKEKIEKASEAMRAATKETQRNGPL
jgi:hypothetical protein